MKELKIEVTLFRISLIFLMFLTVFIIMVYYPYSECSLLRATYISQELNVSNEELYYIPIIFFILTGIPVLIALVFAWLISNHIAKNNIFSKEVLKFLKIIIIVLSIDLIVYFVGNEYFFHKKNWVTTSLFYSRFSIVYAVIIHSLIVLYLIIKKKVLLSQITSINN